MILALCRKAGQPVCLHRHPHAQNITRRGNIVSPNDSCPPLDCQQGRCRAGKHAFAHTSRPVIAPSIVLRDIPSKTGKPLSPNTSRCRNSARL